MVTIKGSIKFLLIYFYLFAIISFLSVNALAETKNYKHTVHPYYTTVVSNTVVSPSSGAHVKVGEEITYELVYTNTTVLPMNITVTIDISDPLVRLSNVTAPSATTDKSGADSVEIHSIPQLAPGDNYKITVNFTPGYPTQNGQPMTIQALVDQGNGPEPMETVTYDVFDLWAEVKLIGLPVDDNIYPGQDIRYELTAVYTGTRLNAPDNPSMRFKIPEITKQSGSSTCSLVDDSSHNNFDDATKEISWDSSAFTNLSDSNRKKSWEICVEVGDTFPYDLKNLESIATISDNNKELSSSDRTPSTEETKAEVEVSFVQQAPNSIEPGKPPYGYTIQVKNTSFRDIHHTGLEVIDYLPTQTTSAGGSAGTKLNNPPHYKFDTQGKKGAVVDLPAGETRTFYLDIEVDAVIDVGIEDAINQVIASYDKGPYPDHQTVLVGVETSHDIVAAPDLYVVQETDLNGVIPKSGDSFTLKVTVFNVGNQNTDNVELVVTLPQGTNRAGNIITENITSLSVGPLGKTFSYSLTLNNPPSEGVITSTAEVFNRVNEPDVLNTYNDLNPAGNTANFNEFPIITSEDVTDITTSLTTPLTSTQPGDLITFIITIDNGNGSVTATNVTAEMNIPSHTQFITSDNPSTVITASKITWDVGDVLAGSSTQIEAVFQVLSDTVPYGLETITATAKAEDGGKDPAPKNNPSKMIAVNLDASPVLVASVTDNEEILRLADMNELDYDIRICNIGEQESNEGTLYLELSDWITPDKDAYRWEINGNLASRDLSKEDHIPVTTTTDDNCFTFRIKGVISDSIDNGSILTTSVGLAYGTWTDVDTTTVESSAEFTITKTDGVASAKFYDTLTYTITIESHGTANPKKDITLYDYLPEGVYFVEAPDYKEYLPSLRRVEWSIDRAALNVGHTVTRTLVVTVGDSFEGSLVNTATVDYDNGTITATAHDETSITPDDRPDLQITKTAPNSIDKKSLTFKYVITVQNVGLAIANDVDITDVLPSEVHYKDKLNVEKGEKFDHQNNVITWTIPQLDVGASRNIFVEVEAIESQLYGVGTITNTAWITELADQELNLDNNKSTVTVTVDGYPPLPTLTNIIVTGFFTAGKGYPSSYQAQVEPVTATRISYSWFVEDGQNVKSQNNYLTATWSTTGTKNIVVTATDVAGHSVSRTYTVTVIDGKVVPILPDKEVVIDDTAGCGSIKITVPKGAVSQPRTFIVYLREEITAPVGYEFANCAFDMTAYDGADNRKLSPFSFSKPITIGFQYDKYDTNNDNNLRVLYRQGRSNPWNETNGAYQLIPAQKKLNVSVDHLTWFGLFEAKIPPENIEITGPITGYTGDEYLVMATIEPPTVTLPITYEWTSSENQSFQGVLALGTTLTQTFSWHSSGNKTITLTVDNQANQPVITGFNITIANPVPVKGCLNQPENSVCVIDDEGYPVGGASVYVEGFPRLRGTTTQDGIWENTTLSNLVPDTNLIVMHQVDEILTDKQKHVVERSNFIYRVYYTNIDIELPNGTPRVSQTVKTGSRYTLRATKRNPLVLFNIIVSLGWDADKETLEEFELAFKEASHFLYDVTDGQMALGWVHIYDKKINFTNADIQITINNPRPSTIEQDTLTSTLKHIKLPEGWDRHGDAEKWSEPDGYRTIIHEFGHYAMLLYDEYEDRDELVYCTHSKEELRNEDIDASIMYNQFYATEFVGDHNKTDACENTDQYTRHGRFDWEHIDTLYPILTPVERGSETAISGPDKEDNPFHLGWIPFPNIKSSNEQGHPKREIIVKDDEGEPIRDAWIHRSKNASDFRGSRNGTRTLYDIAKGEKLYIGSLRGIYEVQSIIVTEEKSYEVTLHQSCISRQGRPHEVAYLDATPFSFNDELELKLNVYYVEQDKSLTVYLDTLVVQETKNELLYSPGGVGNLYSFATAFTNESINKYGTGWLGVLIEDTASNRLSSSSDCNNDEDFIGADFSVTEINSEVQNIVISKDGKAHVRFFENSFNIPSSEKKVLISRLFTLPGIDNTTEWNSVSYGYQIKQEQPSPFEEPAYLKLYYDPDTIYQKGRLSISYWEVEDKKWVELPSKTIEDPSGHAVTTWINHPGTYVIMVDDSNIYLPILTR